MRACVFVCSSFLTVRSAQIRNFYNHFSSYRCCTSATPFSCHCLLLLLLLLLILWLFISADRVCVCARVCAIRYGSTFCFLLVFLYCFTRSLSRARGPPAKYSLNYATTVRSSCLRASVRVSVCLLVGTGADRKITTADRCSASVCLHFSNFAPTHTHTSLVHRVCLILARSPIRRRSSRRYCGVVPILGSLASHAHYHDAATVLAAVFVCTCCVFYCPTRCNGFSCT